MQSCNVSDERNNLSGGWEFVSESKHDKVIDGGKKHIPCEVIAYGFNDEFILAAQKPTEDCFLGKDTIEYKAGRNSTYFWIIAHKQNLFLGPLTETEFKVAKEKYKVPVDLKLNPIE
jgi:hypothetical protein